MLRQVTIGGVVHPISFGVNCLANFARETGLGFGDMVNEIPFHAKLSLIYNALKDGARIEKKPFTMTEEEVGDMLGTNIKLINTLIEYFIEDWEPESKNVVSPAANSEEKS